MAPGTGRPPLALLSARADSRTGVLTRPDAPPRARDFYRAGGWFELVAGVHFPGDSRAFAGLAKELPSRA